MGSFLRSIAPAIRPGSRVDRLKPIPINLREANAPAFLLIIGHSERTYL